MADRAARWILLTAWCWAGGLGLSGCAGAPEAERVTWQCARTPDGRSWDCARRQTSSGGAAAAAVPVAPTASPADEAPADPAPEAKRSIPARKTMPVEELMPREAWAERLPGLQESQPTLATASGAMPVADGPRAAPPEPQPALARWEKRQVGQPSAQPAPERSTTVEVEAPAAVAAAPSAQESVVETRASTAREMPEADPSVQREAVADPAHEGVAGRIDPEGGEPVESVQGMRYRYTVQIGAFPNDRQARAYIDRHRLGELPLDLQRRQRAGREYSVLTFGSFPTAREATAAWQRVAGGRGLDFWVRPAD